MELQEQLSKIGLIEGLTDEQIANLMDICELRKFQHEEKIISEITRTRDLYIIKTGSVSISMCVPMEARKSEVIDRLHAGDMMGEIAFIDGSPRSASVHAEEETEVYVFPYDKIIALMEGDPKLGYVLISGIANILTAKIRQTNLAWRNLMMW
ncbi:MAG: cyclic nucleotide-binding domain-containing protein [Candidatus Electryonea clarkiae]|nr:cyclic nucleotide-binding domain-containing protein [Candidatus Electryonea clarkiae]MDP8285504.1 cyclic nucleotide-binding domain-containing protein [Candidatus Electryonea clarkiae]